MGCYEDPARSFDHKTNRGVRGPAPLREPGPVTPPVPWWGWVVLVAFMTLMSWLSWRAWSWRIGLELDRRPCSCPCSKQER